MVPPRGIDPRSHPYQGRILPLNYEGKVELRVGLEPTSCRLQGDGLTVELPEHTFDHTGLNRSTWYLSLKSYHGCQRCEFVVGLKDGADDWIRTSDDHFGKVRLYP